MCFHYTKANHAQIQNSCSVAPLPPTTPDSASRPLGNALFCRNLTFYIGVKLSVCIRQLVSPRNSLQPAPKVLLEFHLRPALPPANIPTPSSVERFRSYSKTLALWPHSRPMLSIPPATSSEVLVLQEPCLLFPGCGVRSCSTYGARPPASSSQDLQC